MISKSQNTRQSLRARLIDDAVCAAILLGLGMLIVLVPLPAERLQADGRVNGQNWPSRLFSTAGYSVSFPKENAQNR